MLASVAICTWNRCESLRRTLERMASALRVPAGVTWELLIVDNACTDDTDAVIEAFHGRLPIRRLVAPRPGLATARNVAACAAAGEYVLWTDDDALVDPDWMAAYRRAFQRWPDAAFFGGPITPCFPTERPAWLVECWPMVRTAFAELDLGAAPIPLTRDALPFGTNMAFRTDVQRRFGFDPQLGNRARTRVGGEETQLMRDLLAAGHAGRWIPDARVTHVIPTERLTVEYLRTYYTGRGQRVHLEDTADGGARRSVLAWAARACAGEMAYGVGRLVTRPALWVRGLRAASVARGALARRGVRA